MFKELALRLRMAMKLNIFMTGLLMAAPGPLRMLSARRSWNTMVKHRIMLLQLK